MDNESSEDYSSKHKLRITCKARTIQLLTVVNYNFKGNVTYSSKTEGRVNEVVPDSTGDYLMKVICSKNFPNEKNTDNYFPVENPIEATKMLKAELSKNPK